MQDHNQIQIKKAIDLADELNLILESLGNQPSLIRVFFAPVFNTLVEGSRFLKTNLNILYTRYSQRKEAKKD